MSEVVSPAWTAQFRKRLVRWYMRNHRQLPWRETSDPYAIWISEIMLQQTQVATVIDYYHRFLEKFPDVATLAAAEEQEVLHLWAGLGYYRRARQLHAAAKVVVTKFNGEIPQEFEDVLTLPGIGRYTAGAIVSFAYGTRAPILEANTIRLFGRLLALRTDWKQAPAQKTLWSFAESILPKKQGAQAGLVNQASMELGSLICLPKQPKCEICPVSSLCAAYDLGLQAELPSVAPGKSWLPLSHALVIVAYRGKYLMRRNPPGGWWEGLWDFPRADLATVANTSNGQSAPASLPIEYSQVEQVIQQQLDLDCRVMRYVRTIKHSVTRYRISLFCYEAQVAGSLRPMLRAEDGWRWAKLDPGSGIPLTSTAEKLRQWLLSDDSEEARVSAMRKPRQSKNRG